MTTWFERRPGSEESLLALYDVVVAAEELDLAEQARTEARWVEFWTLTRDAYEVVAWWDVDADLEADEPKTESIDQDDAGRPSMSQAIGLVEHQLGGRPFGRADQTA